MATISAPPRPSAARRSTSISAYESPAVPGRTGKPTHVSPASIFAVTREARAWRVAHERGILSEFVALLALPNVASDSTGIERNAAKIRAMLERRGVAVRLLRLPGAPPIVVGDVAAPRGRRTIGFYAHYDGQPADTASWSGLPWTPVLRDPQGQDVALDGGGPVDPESRLYARSSGDDKAPIVAMLAALDALRPLGIEHLDKVIDIDQSPIGRTPRSNPATYTKAFDEIRGFFANLPEARARGYQAGRFSFNVKGGRCERCEGDGVIKVEMHFLPDIYVPCDTCHGKRYNRETLDIRYKGKNISEVLKLTVEDALALFRNVPMVANKLDTLMAVGLGYIELGQNATTLSGGEAQRVKLAKELSKRSTGSTLYVLDEPTTGLHFHDIAQLLEVLYKLRDQGNTIVIIEHNLDVIKTADWIIDLGPEGGAGGGELIVAGPPEAIAAEPRSYTGRALHPTLPQSARGKRVGAKT